MKNGTKNTKELLAEIEELRRQLEEANDTIEAIRTGQVDALIVQNDNGHELYTLTTADRAYRAFIEKMNEGAVTLNPEGIILYANSRFAAMTGKELSQVIGMSLHQFVDPPSHPVLRSLIEACSKKDCKGELQLIAHDKLVPVQISLTMLEQAEGATVNLILTDLSSQKAAQKQLEEANQQLAETNQALEARNHDLQQFASVASHDLQEPLRKVQMFSNIIKDTYSAELNEKGMGYIEKILKATGRMKTLIIDILNYSKLSAKENIYTLTDLNETVNDILDDFELRIQENKANIKVGKLPVLEVNPGQIRQALQNLISNALKFTRTGTTPVIEIMSERLKDKNFDSERQQNGPFCLLSIKDNGIGFDQKYALKIFSLFERLNSKHQFEGTGIGLSITKKIVDNHRGLIRAQSSHDTGSLFQIILPLIQS